MKTSTLLIVADLDEARRFYVDIMGLGLVEASAERLDIASEGHDIHIFEGEGDAKPYAHSADASTTLVFWVEDVDSKKEELQNLGYQFIHSNENDFSKYAAFYGPSDIVHEIAEKRGD